MFVAVFQKIPYSLYHPYHIIHPNSSPRTKLLMKRMDILDVNGKHFLLPEEEKLFKHIMVLNEQAIAFEDAERGTLKDSYFSPYIIPTVPHIPWEYKNIPIAPGLREQVMECAKVKNRSWRLRTESIILPISVVCSPEKEWKVTHRS
jgi:hypothetical protein